MTAVNTIKHDELKAAQIIFLWIALHLPILTPLSIRITTLRSRRGSEGVVTCFEAEKVMVERVEKGCDSRKQDLDNGKYYKFVYTVVSITTIHPNPNQNRRNFDAFVNHSNT